MLACGSLGLIGVSQFLLSFRCVFFSTLFQRCGSVRFFPSSFFRRSSVIFVSHSAHTPTNFKTQCKSISALALPHKKNSTTRQKTPPPLRFQTECSRALISPTQLSLQFIRATSATPPRSARDGSPQTPPENSPLNPSLFSGSVSSTCSRLHNLRCFLHYLRTVPTHHPRNYRAIECLCVLVSKCRYVICPYCHYRRYSP